MKATTPVRDNSHLEIKSDKDPSINSPSISPTFKSGWKLIKKRFGIKKAVETIDIAKIGKLYYYRFLSIPLLLLVYL